ncbi:MAG TPA: hypothetical protein VKA19_02825 [Alphaproteobacteria bacterium]|nr:hypothetical protein [Alphaproteobacteria bacterium]
MGMTQKERLPSQEELLLDYAERLGNHRAGRQAVHLHLSRLQPTLREEHHLRVAADTFDHLVKRHAGQIFQLSNGDLVVIVKGAKTSEIDEAVFKLRYFFRQDPLFAEEPGDGEPDPFVNWYNMETDYPTFFANIQILVQELRALASNPLLALPDDDEEEAELGPRKPAIGPLELARIEASLNSMDVTPFIQRHLACAMDDSGEPRPVFCDYVISFDAIERVLTPKHDLRAEPWLFQRMQEIVNPRILSELVDVAKGGQLPVSVKLPIQTILSPQFLKFHREFKPKIGRRMMVELGVADVFANASSFVFARDFLRDRDYRVAVGDLSLQTVGLVDREAMDVDFEKIVWSPRLARILTPAGIDRFRDVVERTGINRVVLAGCNSRRSLEVGLDCGIRIFQGRYITRVLDKYRSRPEALSA